MVVTRVLSFYWLDTNLIERDQIGVMSVKSACHDLDFTEEDQSENERFKIETSMKCWLSQSHLASVL